MILSHDLNTVSQHFVNGDLGTAGVGVLFT